MTYTSGPEHDEAMALFRNSIPIFQALSDPARQDIIMILSQHEQVNVNDITNQLTLSRPAVSHHLKILRDTGLVSLTKVGTQRYYYLSLDDSVAKLKSLLNKIEDTCL